MRAAAEATGTGGVLGPFVAVVGAVVGALLAAALVSAIVRSVARRSSLAMDVLARARRPMRVSLVILAIWIALRASTEPVGWRDAADQVLVIGLIVSVAWLIGALAFVAEDAALSRYRIDVPDNRHARRVRTQITVLRRVTVAVLAVCALAAVLMTFPGARAAGASLFASAGVLSVIAGLAAQSSLANVFAGLQLAFTDAIRVDDVVVVEGEWGRIEEITMTYIVVHLWDDRRLIMPSTYFTTTPFQNWTRRAADLLGTVELDLDWTVPVDDMRQELSQLLEASDLWDHRVGILQVTEATGGYVRVRALASARDAPTLFDLRCYVREGLVDWLQRAAPGALPRARVEGSLVGEPGAAAPPRLPGPAPGGGAADGAPHEAPPEAPGRAAERAADAGSADDGVLGAHMPITVEVTAVRPAEDDDADDVADVRAMLGATVPIRRSARDAVRGDPADVGERTARLGRTDDSRLFTGTMGAVERGQVFTGPGQEVIRERERTAGRDRPPPLDPVLDAEGRGDRPRAVPLDGGGPGDGP